MPDLWILAFLARGVIAAAGDVMPLDQCLQRGQDMSQNTHITCINVQDPSCRAYLKRSVNCGCIEALHFARWETKGIGMSYTREQIEEEILMAENWGGHAGDKATAMIRQLLAENDALRIAKYAMFDALEEIALAGMSGSG